MHFSHSITQKKEKDLSFEFLMEKQGTPNGAKREIFHFLRKYLQSLIPTLKFKFTRSIFILVTFTIMSRLDVTFYHFYVPL